MMIYSFGPKSRERMKGLHPDLVAVLNRAIQITTQDFAITCGVRTLTEQAALYAQGRTKPGPIVTWTMNSRHIPGVDGFGYAVDLVPSPVDWKDPAKFDAINDAMEIAAAELGIPIRWGADWDQDGNYRERGETDSPHWELER